jgi:hypothetical protein
LHVWLGRFFKTCLVILDIMYLTAVKSLLRSRRFWILQLGSVFIYSIPATIRITTGNIHLPILSMFMVPWVTPYVPGNIVEKILVNAFFPGGAGAVAGEIFFSKVHSLDLNIRQKYLARLAGAWLWVAGWSLFQFWGYLQNVNGTYGDNLFESPLVFPLNFLLASLAIFTPDVVSYINKELVTNYHGLRAKKS